MHPKFAALADSLHPSFVKLIECPPHTGRVRLPLGMPRCGVYLFSEDSDYLYVGGVCGRGRNPTLRIWASDIPRLD